MSEAQDESFVIKSEVALFFQTIDDLNTKIVLFSGEYSNDKISFSKTYLNFDLLWNIQAFFNDSAENDLLFQVILF